MTVERPDMSESSNEERRRLRGKRAGKPGEGFADVRIITGGFWDRMETLGERFARLSTVRARLLGYEDNPEQLLLHCPKCGLMNDFTIKGEQVYYFANELKGERAPVHSTTTHRIHIVRIQQDAVQCSCGKCGEQFLQQC